MKKYQHYIDAQSPWNLPKLASIDHEMPVWCKEGDKLTYIMFIHIETHIKILKLQKSKLIYMFMISSAK